MVGRKFDRKLATPLLVAVILAIGYLDYRSGFMLSLFPLYLVPLLIIAWHDRKSVTIAVSVIAAAMIVIKDDIARYTFRHGIYYYWDEGIKVFLLIAISYGVWKIRNLIREKEKANEELRQALTEIKELREMIPICAWCHSIRNDRGFYERIEVYLSQLTGAQFTHAICPDCMKKYYAELGRPKPQDEEETETPTKK